MKNPFKSWNQRRLPFFAKPVPSHPNDPFIKGYRFEQFVVTMFDTDNYFTLTEWRSDKAVNNVSPLSNKHPDLQFEFQLNGDIYPFVVECKYRERFSAGCIEWAGWPQIDHYRRFSYAMNMPVFVVIGIGGYAHAPEELYSVPLQEIHETILSRQFLAHYRHCNFGKKFFFDRFQHTLK